MKFQFFNKKRTHQKTSNEKVIAKKPLTNLYEMNSTLGITVYYRGDVCVGAALFSDANFGQFCNECVHV